LKRAGPSDKVGSLPVVVAAIVSAMILTPAAAAPDAAPSALADYPTGDSCLFCHRDQAGATWLANSHAWTMRPVGEPPAVGKLASDATHVIGKDHYRALKQTGYGKLALLSADGKQWQDEVFARQCVGCHTTAVNPQTSEYSSVALDCYSCHGNVPEDHAQKKGTALLSVTRKSSPREVLSICGSCHLRGGRSLTTGKPYPHAYVAGADLFKDFKVDLNLDKKQSLDSSDAHVYLKTRAVLEGGSDKSCVNCHKIHRAAQTRDRDRKQFSPVCQY